MVKKIKYPTGRQDFATLIKDGCVYIDKTDLVYSLTEDFKYVFLSRPRRFGKSLPYRYQLFLQNPNISDWKIE